MSVFRTVPSMLADVVFDRDQVGRPQAHVVFGFSPSDFEEDYSGDPDEMFFRTATIVLNHHSKMSGLVELLNSGLPLPNQIKTLDKLDPSKLLRKKTMNKLVQVKLSHDWAGGIECISVYLGPWACEYNPQMIVQTFKEEMGG